LERCLHFDQPQFSLFNTPHERSHIAVGLFLHARRVYLHYYRTHINAESLFLSPSQNPAFMRYAVCFIREQITLGRGEKVQSHFAWKMSHYLKQDTFSGDKQ
jgi:hypothetical protein